MTRSCENAPVHSELFACSTLTTMESGDATDAGLTSSTVHRDCPFPTRSGTVRLDDCPLLIPSTMNWITLPVCRPSGSFQSLTNWPELFSKWNGLVCQLRFGGGGYFGEAGRLSWMRSMPIAIAWRMPEPVP
jgi:hypothetical protein